MNYTAYRKLIAAVIGVVAMQLGPDYIPAPEALTEAVLGGLTALGVWAVPNTSQ